MPAPTFIAPANPLDKRTLGKFEVLCRLSTGGMSEIYLAHQKGLAGFRKLVVLKTILPDIGGEEDFVRMFLDEARTTAAFAHPNIAQVFELDVDDGQLFMAMEFVQGCTLVEMARACRQAKEAIPIGFTLPAVRDTALALHYAHTFVDARGRKQVVIHRDVAEKNIMVTYQGVTKLLDFGIAKAQGRSGRTSVGMVKGTSGYMSPEQIRGEPLDGRSDIFALGIVLHECLTGMRLFHGKTAEEGMMAALNQVIAPPSKLNPRIWPELDAVVMKALARNREERFATALEFGRAIDRVGKDELWATEKSGELVVRFFAERRSETSRLLESMFGDTTGEVRIDSLMAKVRASANPSAPPAPPPKAPAAQPAGRGDAQTAPARPRHQPPTPPVPPPRGTSAPPPPPQGMVPSRTDFDEDSDAKTIPASSLPEELKALRAKFKSQRPDIGAGVVPKQKADVSDRPTNPSAVPPNIVVDEGITSDVPVRPPRKQSVVETMPVPVPSAPSVPGGLKTGFGDDEEDARTVMAGKDELMAGVVVPEDLKRTILETHESTQSRKTVADPQTETNNDLGVVPTNTGESATIGAQEDEQDAGGGIWVWLLVFLIIALAGATVGLYVLKLGPFEP